MLTVLRHRVTRFSPNICAQYDLLCAVCSKIVSHSDLGQTLSESLTPNRLFISGWCQRAPGWYGGWASGKCCIQRWVFVWRPFVALSHTCIIADLACQAAQTIMTVHITVWLFFFFFFFFNKFGWNACAATIFSPLIVYVVSVMAVVL